MSKIEQQKTFDNEGTFEAYYAAKAWLVENGYSYGSTCGDEPVAIMRGEYDLPQKWRNMSGKDRESVHGVITGDKREGPVTVTIYARP